MKLRQIASNMTELSFDEGTRILFSYQTPVAGRHSDTFFKTATKYSRTTSRHIKKYFSDEFDWDSDSVVEYRQESIDSILNDKITL